VKAKNLCCSPADSPFSPSISNFQPFINHILIIRPGALGDVVITLPTFFAIRNYFYNAHIEIMGYASFLEIIKGRFYADTVSRFDQADSAALFIKNAQLPECLEKRLRGMDMIISFLLDKDGIFIENLKAAGTRHVVHYEPFPPHGERIHIIDHFLNFLHSIDIPFYYDTPRIFLQKDDMYFGDNFIKDRIADPQKMLIAIHPGSSSRQKCWPVESYAELLLWLNKEMNVQPLIVSGPSDIEIIEELKVRVKESFILVDHLPLPHLAAVIKRCNLFIGNDSGITHLAAALGTRTIAIFGPTDPNIWGPRGEQVKILCKGIPCSPCLPDTRRNCLSQICLEKVSTKDVIHEVDTFLRFSQDK